MPTIILSYIVPIYNVATYLRRCVNSLLQQGLEADTYEIILVDDGSTDGSGSIADELCSQYTQIKVIHQPNAGLSAARNTGTAAASGRFLQYVDSDDYLQSDTATSLLAIAEEKKLDVLRFDYRNVNERGEEVHPNRQQRPWCDYSETVVDGVTFLNSRLGYACYACQFIIRSSLAKKTPFTNGILFEDTEWVPRLMSATDRICSTSLVAYNYLLRLGSITKATNEEQQMRIADNELALIKRLRQQAETWEDKRWFQSMTSQTAVSFLDRISTHLYQRRKKYLQSFNAMRLRPLTLKHTTKSAKRKLLMINISPALYCVMKKKLT